MYYKNSPILHRCICLFTLFLSFSPSFGKNKAEFIDYPALSEKLAEMSLHNREHEYDSLLTLIASVKFDILKNQLYSDTRKKTFWMNVHNAFAIHAVRKQPTLLKNHSQFLSIRQINVAGTTLSLNEIFHGILRRSNYRITETEPIKQFRVLMIDYRIHFGITVGAKDCPPFVPFNEHTLNDQLKSLENRFITEHAVVDSVKKEIRISELFEWYLKDFGGTASLGSLFERNGIKSEKDWKFKFITFNWDPIF